MAKINISRYRNVSIVLPALLLLAAGAAPGAEDYADFRVVRDLPGSRAGLGDDLERILRERPVAAGPLRILVPPSLGEPRSFPEGIAPAAAPGDNWYVLDNRRGPIVISRDLFLHGGSPRATRIVPLDPRQPLFALAPGFAGRVNVAGITFASPRTSDTEGVWCIRDGDCGERNAGCACDPVCEAEPGSCGCSGAGVSFATEHRAFDFAGAGEGFRFEMLDAVLKRVSLHVTGPGLYRIESTVVASDGAVTAPLLVDHPGADVLLVGVDFGSPIKRIAGPETMRGPMAHAHQRRGRLRVYGGGTTATFGNADFLIEGAAEAGPHIFAGLRTEGRNYVPGPHVSSLVHVPPSEDAIDLVVKGSETAWYACDTACPGCSYDDLAGLPYLVNYNARGDVWLLGNSARSAGRLAVGDLSRAGVHAVGNLVRNPDPIGVGNLYDHREAYDCAGCTPAHRFVGGNPERLPRPAPDALPLPLTRPVMSRPPAGLGMLEPARCSGDRAQRLQLALDCAMLADPASDPVCRARCEIPDDFRPGMVFVAAGEWKIDRPLRWFHVGQLREEGPLDRGRACLLEGLNRCAVERFHGSAAGRGTSSTRTGLWLAGPGRRKTTIRSRVGGTVFESSSAVGLVAQGITFRTKPYTVEGDRESAPDAAVRFEYVRPDQRPEKVHLPATQDNYFHDVAFDGGKYAMAIALSTATQSDNFVFVGSKFRNAKYGLAVRGPNAVMVLVRDPLADDTDPTFSNNVVAMGNGDNEGVSCCCLAGEAGGFAACKPDRKRGRTCPSGARVDPLYPTRDPASLEPRPFSAGHWVVLGATVRGTRWRDIGEFASTLYLHGLDTDSEALHGRCDLGLAGFPRFLFLDRPRFAAPRAPAGRPLLDWRTGGGSFFLYPRIDSDRRRETIHFEGPPTSAFAVLVPETCDNELWDRVDADPARHRAFEWKAATCDPGPTNPPDAPVEPGVVRDCTPALERRCRDRGLVCHEQATAHLPVLGSRHPDRCIPVCPAPRICKTDPLPDDPATLGELCALPGGGFLGCPAGQTLYLSPYDCTNRKTPSTASLYCAPIGVKSSPNVSGGVRSSP